MLEVTKLNGEPFGKKGPLISLLKRKGLEEDYIPERKGSGWVGVRKDMAEEKPEREPKPAPLKREKIKVRVYRTNVDPDNKDLIISVTANDKSQKSVFYPGQEVELTPIQINVLKDAVYENEFEIPPDSGIYESNDPLMTAKSYWPGHQVKRDPVSGLIKAIKREPNYIVERVE